MKPKPKTDILTLLLNPPLLNTAEKSLLLWSLTPEQPLSELEIQSLQDSGWLQGTILTPTGTALAEAAAARLQTWLQSLLLASAGITASVFQPRSPAAPLTGRTRNRVIADYVKQQQGRVTLNKLLADLGYEGCRSAVKKFISRDARMGLKGRAEQAYVWWVGGDAARVTLDRRGASAPYDPKRVMDALQAALTPCRGFLNFLPGVAIDDDTDIASPTLNVQYEVSFGSCVEATRGALLYDAANPQAQVEPELDTDPWLLVTADTLREALEYILLERPRIFELRQVKRDLREWLTHPDGAPLGAIPSLYIWQHLTTGQITHKAVDRRELEV